MQAEGFRVDDRYETYFAALSRAFTSQEILRPSTLTAMGLNELLNHFILGQKGDLRTVIYIQPTKDLWMRSEVRQFKTMVQQKLTEQGIPAANVTMTGANLLTGELKDLILKNLRSSLGLAGISILLVLLIYYRDITAVLLSLLPLMVGLAVLSGVMVVLRINYNFLNIMIIPMIVGIGLDDGVHFTNTYRQSRPAQRLKGLMRTGRAVVLTSLTTLIGFGSITLSHYPGLQSMGMVSVIGITACLLATLVILPPLFHLIDRFKLKTLQQAAGNLPRKELGPF
jgi:predicted RND superfamily exporter protein